MNLSSPSPTLSPTNFPTASPLSCGGQYYLDKPYPPLTTGLQCRDDCKTGNPSDLYSNFTRLATFSSTGEKSRASRQLRNYDWGGGERVPGQSYPTEVLGELEYCFVDFSYSLTEHSEWAWAGGEQT